MLLAIPDVLTDSEIERARNLLFEAEWVDGRVTAGHQSARAKDNLQIPEDHPVARGLGTTIITALQRSSLFVSAALPLRVFPPLFNRYQAGQSFGKTRRQRSAADAGSAPSHSYRPFSDALRDTTRRVRRRRARGRGHLWGPSGQTSPRPSHSLSGDEPSSRATGDRGVRLASFFWIQSMVRDDGERTLLFDLERAIQSIDVALAGHPATLELTNVFHNLLRRWADL